MEIGLKVVIDNKKRCAFESFFFHIGFIKVVIDLFVDRAALGDT